MADSHAKMTKTTPQQVIISIVAGLIAPLLTIFLIVMLVLGIQGSHKPDASSEAAQKAALERIKPVAQLDVQEAPAPGAEAPAAAAPPKPDPAKGKQVYQTICTACHGAGVAGAPKLGDKEAWGPRVAQGYATLYDHALNGIRGMPAKGGNPSLSESDLANAVGYMVTESGGKL
ncbi:MAG: hypothetical protein QG662_1748 [Pseudomonadota bacterium]|nr:hypothetical protein [Pseudomonadota bacterium]